MDNFKNAARIALDFHIRRYLRSNAKGRLNGHEKALQHAEMCAFYVAVKHKMASTHFLRVHEISNADYQIVHEETQSLTSYLDKQIGFPLDTAPDYDDLVPKFFEKFHEIATRVLGLNP